MPYKGVRRRWALHVQFGTSIRPRFVVLPHDERELFSAAGALQPTMPSSQASLRAEWSARGASARVRPAVARAPTFTAPTYVRGSSPPRLLEEREMQRTEAAATRLQLDYTPQQDQKLWSNACTTHAIAQIFAAICSYLDELCQCACGVAE